MDVIFSIYDAIDLIANITVCFWFVLQFLFCFLCPMPEKFDRYFCIWVDVTLASFALAWVLIDYFDTWSTTMTIITTTVVPWVMFHGCTFIYLVLRLFNRRKYYATPEATEWLRE